MPSRFRRGLVVGKLAPLHRGHELVVATALAACDEVVVLSWASPEPPGCEAARRQRWLDAVFATPRVRALAVDDAVLHERARGELGGWRVPPDDAAPEVQRRFTALLLRDVLGVAVDAVFGSEPYVAALAAALGPAVEPVLVDPARARVPISATAIRADVHGHRRWLAPAVYASFVERVAVLGGESAGKTTLAAALAGRLGTVWVPEHGRERWEARGGRLAFADLEAIGVEQVAREERAAGEATRWLLCDTSPLTTLFYSLDLFGRASARLHELAQRPYDHVVLCAPDVPFVQDGTRRDAAFRARQHAWYEDELRRRGVPWLSAQGPLAARVEAVAVALAGTAGAASTAGSAAGSQSPGSGAMPSARQSSG